MKRALNLKATEQVSAPIRRAATLALARLRAGGVLVIVDGAEQTDLPPAVARKVAVLLGVYADGQSPSVLASDDDLTTQEAADLLGLSRPTVVKMMDSGRLPYKQPGKHRRVRRSDLEAFRASLRRGQSDALAALSALGQAMERDAREEGSFQDEMI